MAGENQLVLTATHQGLEVDMEIWEGLALWIWMRLDDAFSSMS